MGKKKKSISAKSSEEKAKKSPKIECCEKYLKKGEHKRCKRCPCLDMSETQRIQRFKDLKIEVNLKIKNYIS